MSFPSVVLRHALKNVPMHHRAKTDKNKQTKTNVFNSLKFDELTFLFKLNSVF